MCGLRYSSVVLSPPSVSELGSFAELRTAATPDESQLRVRGRIGSAVMYVESVRSSLEGSATVLSVRSNFPFLAGWHFTPYFDYTLEIPPGVSEVRIGPSRAVLWRRGDCRRRYQSHDGWHCDDQNT